MHLIDKDPVPKASSTPPEKKDSLGSALKNKIKGVGSKLRSMAGAPGRGAFKLYDKAINEPKRKKSDYEYKVIKDYQRYKQSGRPFVPSKPNMKGATGDQRMIAEYELIKDKLSK